MQFIPIYKERNNIKAFKREMRTSGQASNALKNLSKHPRETAI